MANKYFQFKQFTIHQDQCAMKVCTDACLFGALIANCQLQTANCLDIGAGTGLLSLMYAQKNPTAIIDAVEIDAHAARQAEDNFETSPWNDRLNIINADIKDLGKEKKYGLIISNPPFFEDNLWSVVESKNAAKHEATLTLRELLESVIHRLDKNGCLAVLLPYHRLDYFENEAGSQGLMLYRKLLIRQTPVHDLFRGILFFKKEKSEVQSTEMSIRRTDGSYTAEFIGLLRDYYLHL